MTYTIIDTTDADAPITSSALNIVAIPIKVNNMTFQVIAVGFDAADAVVKLMHSNDGTNFIDITGASLTIASGSSTPMSDIITNIGTTYYAVDFDEGTNSAGTVKVILSFN